MTGQIVVYVSLQRIQAVAMVLMLWSVNLGQLEIKNFPVGNFINI
jgi:hypothetical protein